ncbi:sensor histidine kinase [Dactylosporangium vinaceum]|uniref:histidine kinase n=1 Tax=Dactylosporangium vinaceum TaxID=53362 RepID=A0ABV5M880_9ACTN|nr:sensor histidine kinase [Dactylosporangium vinaceum]UAB94281.1 sensor histidine kinase [Dactylosporangium vinaceum]
MGWIARGLWGLIAAKDPPVHPRTKVGRALPMAGAILGILCGLLAFEYYQGNVPEADTRNWIQIIACSILIAVPIGIVATRPLLAWRIAFFAAIYTSLVLKIVQGTPWPFQPVQIMSYPVILFVVAVRHRREVVVAAGLSAFLLILAYVNPGNVAGLFLLVLAVLVIGDQIRRRREVQRELAEEAERTELAQARRAIAEERNRIAREMHDIVAHHMSLIAVRAETAVYRIEGVPPAVAEELQAIAGTSREALTEMRRLLGVLRDDSVPLTEPQPTLEELSGLIREARAAGVQIEYSPAPGIEVPPGVGLAAYRIVQEALSNARRHAAGAPVAIVIFRDQAELRVFVRNEPTGRPLVPEGKGHGLIGMHERATAIGGTLRAAPAADGGYEVVATLPLGDA